MTFKGSRKILQGKSKIILAVIVVGLVVIGAVLFLNRTSEPEIVMEHVHGLGYTADGKLVTPAHDGLRVYADGEWSIPEGEKHDYMGFSMVDEGFYSSGHPAPGSDRINPFGVVKSTDLGQTLETLDLEGEADFHGMSVGYKTHTIYVINPEPNSQMDAVGMYYTQDETKTWKKSDMQGLTEELTTLAAHPTDDAVIAVGTNTGVFLSEDYGHTFKKINDTVQVTSLYFSPQGELFVGGVNQGPKFFQLDLQSGETTPVNLPPLNDDAVMYIAQSTEGEELAFVSFNLHMYVTNDQGENWKQIVNDGKGISGESG